MLAYMNNSSISPGGLPHVDVSSNPHSNVLGTLLSITFGIVGALSLLMITVSGLRYITSAGDPQKTAGAKNGIVYSLVGLIVAITAEAIVVFVVNRL